MGELINLNKVRKAKARNVARATAEANRIKYGRTKAENHRAREEAARAARLLDGAKLEKD